MYLEKNNGGISNKRDNYGRKYRKKYICKPGENRPF